MIAEDMHQLFVLLNLALMLMSHDTHVVRAGKISFKREQIISSTQLISYLVVSKGQQMREKSR